MSVLVDHQIRLLCLGVVPPKIAIHYNEKGYSLPPRIQPLVTPYNHELVNPHSLDICIGNHAKLRLKEPFLAKCRRKLTNLGIWIKWFFTEDFVADRHYTSRPKTYKEFSLASYSIDRPYWLKPGDRLLIESLETFHIPEFTASTFYLKSSRGREWYGHQLAGYIDAGLNDSLLTMEITNDDLEPLPIYPGLKFGQLEFRLLSDLPSESYAKTGRYNGDRQVQESKG